MKNAIDEMGTNDGFHGYGPEQGYLWLREAVALSDYQSRGKPQDYTHFAPEIFKESCLIMSKGKAAITNSL